jgi:hypothetical protein
VFRFQRLKYSGVWSGKFWLHWLFLFFQEPSTVIQFVISYHQTLRWWTSQKLGIFFFAKPWVLLWVDRVRDLNRTNFANWECFFNFQFLTSFRETRFDSKPYKVRLRFLWGWKFDVLMVVLIYFHIDGLLWTITRGESELNTVYPSRYNFPKLQKGFLWTIWLWLIFVDNDLLDPRSSEFVLLLPLLYGTVGTSKVSIFSSFGISLHLSTLF